MSVSGSHAGKWLRSHRGRTVLVESHSCVVRSVRPIPVRGGVWPGLAALGQIGWECPTRAVPWGSVGFRGVPWLGYPHATGGMGCRRQAQGRGQVEPPGGREVLHPIDASGLFAAIVLTHAPNRPAAGRPGDHQEALEPVDSLDIAPTRGSVDAGLELEDAAFHRWPRQVSPFIHWRFRRAYDVCTPTTTSTSQVAGPTSAYPGRYPRHASWVIPPPARMRVMPAPSSTSMESGRAVTSFLPVVLRGGRVTLSTGGLDMNAGRVLPRRGPTRALLGQAATPRRLVQRDDGSSVHALALPMATCKQRRPVGVRANCVTPLYRLMISRYGRGAASPAFTRGWGFHPSSTVTLSRIPPPLPSLARA